MREALMRDMERIGVRFLRGDECLGDASGAQGWYVIPVVLCIAFFEMEVDPLLLGSRYYASSVFHETFDERTFEFQLTLRP